MQPLSVIGHIGVFIVIFIVIFFIIQYWNTSTLYHPLHSDSNQSNMYYCNTTVETLPFHLTVSAASVSVCGGQTGSPYRGGQTGSLYVGDRQVLCNMGDRQVLCSIGMWGDRQVLYNSSVGRQTGSL